MMKRMANFVLGVVVLLVAVQPKLLVHFCGENFIAFYLNQDPATIQSACRTSNTSNNSSSLEKYSCPMRQLMVVDVDSDDFTPSQPPAYSFSSEWQTLPLFILEVVHPLLPQQDVVHLLSAKSPPQSPLPLTGRDLLLLHATFLI
ncbi:MAG: hypothetical protein ACRC3Z_06190 [Phocaeicola sp.]